MIIGSNPVVTLRLLSGEMQFSLLMSLTCSLHLLLAHSDIWLLTSSQSVQQFAHHMYQVILTGTTIAKLLRDVMYNDREAALHSRSDSRPFYIQ